MAAVGNSDRESLRELVRKPEATTACLVGLGAPPLGLCLVDGERRLLDRRLEEAGPADLFEVYTTVDDARASLRPSR